MVKPLNKRFLKYPRTFSQDLSSAALSYTTEIANGFRLDEVYLKASENITETVTITLDSNEGAAHDVILYKRTLSAQRSLVFRPDGEANYHVGDEIKVECTNANGTGTVAGGVKTSEL